MEHKLGNPTPWSSRARRLEKKWCTWGHRNFRYDVTETLQSIWRSKWRILDVGCGIGITYSQLPPQIQKCYMGVDFTPEVIAVCRSKYPQGAWELGDARNLRFPVDSFQIATTTNVLQHILEWKEAAMELVRIASRYVVNTERIHKMETTVVSENPVLRRRFNPSDLIDFYSQYGSTRFRWVLNSGGNKTLGIFITELN